MVVVSKSELAIRSDVHCCGNDISRYTVIALDSIVSQVQEYTIIESHVCETKTLDCQLMQI